jgi:probable addiction module antidote protein
MRKYRKFRDALIDDLCSDPEQAYVYLQVALEEFDQDGDTEHLMLALRNVAEARGGVPELARQTNMGKTSLYRALSEKGNPTLSTVGTILRGLGYRLAIAPVEPKP